jgi:hypothetical protein
VVLKTCKVSCIDLQGVEHEIEVSAGSLYEAVAQALRIFRDNEWVEDLGPGQTPTLLQAERNAAPYRCAATTSTTAMVPFP